MAMQHVIVVITILQKLDLHQQYVAMAIAFVMMVGEWCFKEDIEHLVV